MQNLAATCLLASVLCIPTVFIRWWVIKVITLHCWYLIILTTQLSSSSLICGELKFILTAVRVSCVLQQTDFVPFRFLCKYVRIACMGVCNWCTSSSDVDSECCSWESIARHHYYTVLMYSRGRYWLLIVGFSNSYVSVCLSLMWGCRWWCVKTLTVGVLRQAAEMRCLRCSYDSPSCL